MKRFLIAIAAVVALCASVSAQNANRTGFFVEAGIGGMTGNTPRIGMSWSGADTYVRYAGGTAFSFALGQRMASSTHSAFEFRLQAQSGTSHPGSAFIGKLMFGYRYTSPELFGNMSLYATAGVGGAIGNRGWVPVDGTGNEVYNDNYGYYDYVEMYPESGSKYVGLFEDNISAGCAYSLGIGLNITTHFYAGFVYDGQYMLKQYRIRKDNLNWGMVAFRIGYRF